MKFNSSIEILKPQKLVAEYFANPDHLDEYQEGFLRKILISGEEGKAGTVSKMFYQYGKGEMELTETITNNSLPDSFSGSYHHKHMDNTLTSKFQTIDKNRTLYSIEGEYTSFRGFLPKLMGLVFPGMFRRQAEKWMRNFKEFVESQP